MTLIKLIYTNFFDTRGFFKCKCGMDCLLVVRKSAKGTSAKVFTQRSA